MIELSKKGKQLKKGVLRQEKNPPEISQQTRLKPEPALRDYKKQVIERLSSLIPILQKVAMGDFSENIIVLEKEDEFTEFLASLNVMIDDLKELTEAQKRTQENLEKKVKERTKELENSKTTLTNTLENVEGSRKALMNMLEDVEESRKALINMLEDVEGAREKAEEEKDKTLTIINNFSDGLLVFDKENKLLLVNPQAENFLDVKAKEIINNSILELTRFPHFRTLVSLFGIEIKGIFRGELTIKENLTLEMSTVSIMAEGKKLGTLVILHNITREKMVEKIKTEFVSLAAHQLRTPLSAIKWTLRMLLDEDLGEITKEQKEFIEKSYRSNERMISLINDLLDITRIEEGRYLYKPILADFESVMHFVINSYQEEIARKEISLDFKKPEIRLPKVAIDVEKMRLVIQNFLDNAIKYTPPSGKITILLEYNKDKEEIIFSIKDTGVGIPQDQQVRVFTKFFRGANVMRMETEGSGLGLFISKNIVEAHGGRTWFESEEGKGTTFHIALPIREKFEEFIKGL